MLKEIDETRAPAPPKILTLLFILFALSLFSAYAYTVWTNQTHPGRAYAWFVKGRNFLHGTR